MDHFQTIAQLMLANCPPDHQHSAVLKAELDTGFADLDLVCRNDRSEEIQADLPGRGAYDLHRALDALREDMARDGRGRWERIVFTITPDHKFKADFKYQGQE